MHNNSNSNQGTPIKQISISNDEFFKTAISFINEGKQVQIPAKGNSMLPFIREGKDTIILEKLNENSIKKGNIVLALQNNGRYVVHRIEKAKGNNVTLRGDGNPYARENCTKQDIIAEVTTVNRGKKIIRKNNAFWQLNKHLWPASPLYRRILLKAYRTIHPQKNNSHSNSSQNTNQ